MAAFPLTRQGYKTISPAPGRSSRRLGPGRLSRRPGPGRGGLSAIRVLARDARGVTAIMFALMLPVIIGFVGIGVEVGFWYMSDRSLQNAADSGATTGVFEKLIGSTTAVRDAQALSDAQRNGYDNSSGTFALNSSPASGAYTGDTNAVEVILTEPRNLLFAGMFLDSAVTINARAVATLGVGSTACVLALSTSAAKAINIAGTSTLDMAGCTVAANSDAANAINQTGGGSLTADCLSTVGGTSGSFNVTCDPVLTNSVETPDPYSGLTIDTSDIGNCDQDPPGNTPYQPSNGETLNPGTYCDGIRVNAGVTITMSSGTYYMDGGDFNVNGSATVTGTGVTIILTSYNESGYGDVNISGGANVTLTAPTSDPYSGILFFQDPVAPTSPSSSFDFNGGSTMELTGVIYVPNNAIDFTGGNTTTGNCTMIVGLTVDFSGNADINSNCSGTGVTSPSVYDKVTLVE